MNIPGITKDQLNFIIKVIPANYEVKLFGSRIKGDFRELSDLDVCILSDIQRGEVAKLNEQFEESNLHFTVDIVLYGDCSTEFKRIIDTTGVNLRDVTTNT